MIPPVVDETPLFLPVVEAARRSGIAPGVVEALARGGRTADVDPPAIGSTRGTSGRSLVHLPDVMLFAGALADSGLTRKYRFEESPARGDPIPF